MQNHILAICFDFGDTLADEASEVKDASQTTLKAELIPGAGDLLHLLKARAYKLALVADGRPGTYANVLRQHGVYDLFDAFAISELLGVSKPNPEMFLHALTQMGIPGKDLGRTIMVGNRLDRDVAGANKLGMVSVWLDWSPRYAKIPDGPDEIPRFTIHEPVELVGILEHLEDAGALTADPRLES